MSEVAPILVVHRDAEFAARVLHGLRERGREARACHSLAEALAQAPFDLLICDVSLRDNGACGLLQTLELRSIGPVVVTARELDLPACLKALRAGVRDVYLESSDLTELYASVDRLTPKPVLPSPVAADRLLVVDRADLENHGNALRELLGYLITRGFAGASRARIASATAEVLENVTRHAYLDGDGSFRLEATLRGRQLTVEISDDGVGFDAQSIDVALAHANGDSGLCRARALAEDLKTFNRPEGGARVVLDFRATSLLFADERGIDLSELDYLDPATSRRVLASLRDAGADVGFHLSPALAVCVGRLLSASRPIERPVAELWS